MSDGSKMTRALAKKLGSFEALGRLLGVSGRAAKHYADGIRVPRPAVRSALEGLGVPASSWPVSNRPGGLARSTKAEAAPARSKDAEPLEQTNGAPVSGRAEETPAPSAPEEDGLDARELVRKILAEARGLLRQARADRQASYRDKASLLNAATAAVRLLARVSGALEITEAQIVRSLPFREVLARVEDALTPFPEAARSVGEALRPRGREGG